MCSSDDDVIYVGLICKTRMFGSTKNYVRQRSMKNYEI